MSSPAYVQQEGKNVDIGYSILDITKHSLKMILQSLKPCDRLSLVTFSTDSEVLCNLIYITDDNIRYICLEFILQEHISMRFRGRSLN